MFSRKNYECLISAVIDPYMPGNGPRFVLTLWDTGNWGDYGKKIIAYELVSSEDGSLAKGEDYHVPPTWGVDKMVANIFGFFRGELGRHADAVECEVANRYGEE